MASIIDEIESLATNKYLWSVAVLAFFVPAYAIVLGLIAIDAVVTWWLKHFSIDVIGTGLASVAAVLAGLYYGPLIGGITGFLAVILTFAAASAAGVFWVWKIIGYVLVGVAAGFLGADMLVSAASILIVMRVSFLILSIYSTSSISRSIVYESTSAALSVAILLGLGNRLLEAMSVLG